MNVLYKKQQNCLVDRASESCGNNPGSLPEGARYNESDNVISRHKMILLLKFALMNYALVKFLDVNSPIG